MLKAYKHDTGLSLVNSDLQICIFILPIKDMGFVKKNLSVI